MNKLLDTNVILYFLGGKLAEPLSDEKYYVSVITEIELLSYPKLKKMEEKNIRGFLSELIIIDLDDEIKKATIKLRKKSMLKIPDAIIAATALTLNAKLLTNDASFLRIPELHCKQFKLI